MADNNLQTLIRRTLSYEFTDGIRDFHHAFWILITGIYAWIALDLPSIWLPFAEFAKSQGLLVTLFITFVLPIGLPLIVSQIGLHLINEYVRRPWLWRNTGFIRPKSWILPPNVILISLGITFGTFVAGILLAIQFSDASLILKGMYAGVGFGCVCMYAAAYVILQLPRYRLVSLIGAAGTLIVLVFPLRVGLVPLIFSLFWVAVLVISGLYGVMQVAEEQKRLADAA